MDMNKGIIRENIEYDILLERRPHAKEKLDEIVDLMNITVCATVKTIRIGNDVYDANVVKERLLNLNSSHIEYLLDVMNNNTEKIWNIKQYMLTVLFNAPSMMNNYSR